MLYACRYADALAHFKEAVVLEPMACGYLSYLGLATAHAERRFADAEQLCRRSIEREYHRPEHYHNLGEVQLLAGRRKEALKAFNQALSWNPSYEASLDALRKMGVRRPPVIPALSRNHPINVFLGKTLRRSRRVPRHR